MKGAIAIAAGLLAGALSACERPTTFGARRDAPRLGQGETTVAVGTRREERPTPPPAASPTPTPSPMRSRADDEPPAPTSSRSSGMRELERSIAHWRERCQPLQAAVESRERSLAEREANMDRYLENWPHNELRRQREQQYRARLDQERAELERAREALSACEDGARRDGVSPTQIE